MAGDHACPVCAARFTRPQHVTRHMRSHTGDRPYKCTQCGDQFARSDLLSRHVNKCHNGLPPSTTARSRKALANAASVTKGASQSNVPPSPTRSTHNVPMGLSNTASDSPCDQCIQMGQQCDLGAPCGKCILFKSKCTYLSRARLPLGKGGTLQPGPQQDYAFRNTDGQYNAVPTHLGGAFGTGSGIGATANNYGGLAFSSGGGIPVLPPVPRYLYDDQSRQQYGSGSNASGYSLPTFHATTQSSALPRTTGRQFGAGSPAGSLQGPSAQSQAYPLSYNLPSLSDTGYASDDSPDLRYQHRAGDPGYSNGHQRRASLQFPAGAHSPLKSNAFNSESYQFDQEFPTQFNAYPSNDTDYPNAPNQLPYTTSATSTNPLLNRIFDGHRVNDRVSGSPVGRHAKTSSLGANGIMYDDASSISDGGAAGSGGSNAPSPVPSSLSLSGSGMSRPTSSAGSGGAFGRTSFAGSATAHSGDGASSGFVSSLQGAIPLPTPLQIHSFHPGLGGAGGPNDRTPGGIPPPYQSFDKMKLEEDSFAAAARNVSDNLDLPPPPNTNPNGYGANAQAHLLSAGGKERAINELKEFWSAFISEPLTGGSAAALVNASGGSNSSSSNGLARQASMPALKTPMPMSSERSSILGNGIGSMESVTPRSSVTGTAAYPHGPSLLGRLDSSSQTRAQPAVQSILPPPRTTEEADLRKYQEACLKRETPMLRLIARPKSSGRVRGATTTGAVHGPPLTQAIKMMLPPPPPTHVSHQDVRMNSPGGYNTGREKDWADHYRSGAVNIPNETATAGGSDSNNPATSVSPASTSSSTVTTRPSYKRLPSQTLGPENSKKQALDESAVGDDGDDEADGNSFGVSYPIAGYHGGGNGAGGGMAAWHRQRSVSSPTSMRPFDWQTLSGGAVGR